TACGGGGTKDSTGAGASGGAPRTIVAQTGNQGTPKKGGRANAVVNSSQQYLSMDPAATGQQYAHFGNHSILMNEHLLTFDWDDPARFKPRLAEAIEQPEPTTYVIKLRSGVKFSNDDTVTSEAMKFAIERQDRKLPGTPFTGAIPVFPRVDAVDPLTVRLRIDKPYPDMYQDLTGTLGIPISAKYYNTSDDPWGFADAKQLKPVTAAPFRVKNFRPRETVELERFDGYWSGPKY